MFLKNGDGEVSGKVGIHIAATLVLCWPFHLYMFLYSLEI